MNKTLVNKILVIALHVCGWALLFSLPLRFLSRTTPLLEKRREIIERSQTRDFRETVTNSIPFDPAMIQVESILSNGLLFIFFYTNMFILVPKILNRKGWATYGLLIILSLVIYLVTSYLFRYYFVRFGTFNPPLFIGVPNFFMVFGLSLALRLMQDRSAYENLLKEREHEKLKSELSFLRSQVSPHFMFNILNSLASLARKKSDHLESAIIQLSQLMRYSLYHTDKKVSLEQEADYISNYIELQRMRLGSMITLHYHVGVQRKDLMMEPMLLIPFVENAFKHGVGMIKNPVINVSLEASSYGINFNVKNKFNPAATDIKDSSNGIGIQNVTRRLDLLYKDLYALKTYTENDWFIVDLKLIAE
jgi:two-component system, LytTR family, sensor kinase